MKMQRIYDFFLLMVCGVVLSQPALADGWIQGPHQTLVFDDSSATAALVEKKQKKYSGDIHYLIGDLSDRWSRSDYDRFYNVARKLSKKGLRTVIHVEAKEADLRQTLADPVAVGLIWNSHGSKNGAIYDADEKRLPRGLFSRAARSELRYVLFANCYGQASIHYYGANRLPKVLTKGWPGDATSEMFFHYVYSSEFDQDLEKALNQ